MKATFAVVNYTSSNLSIKDIIDVPFISPTHKRTEGRAPHVPGVGL